jgi:hypothetical protein
MSKEREDRVKTRAYAIWEREGRPEGRHEDHWHMASEELGSDSHPEARSLGSAAQSDLIPEERGSERAGSLVDTGPAIGLAVGTAGAAAGLGNLSDSHGESQVDEPGGMASIGSAEAPAKRPRARKPKATQT